MTLLEAHNLPFAIAVMIFVFIAVLQIVGAGDWFDSGDVDIDLDLDGPSGGGFVDGMMSLLGIGRVPFLVWLIVLLFTFAAIGVAGQQSLIAITGAPLPTLLAALAAGTAALPLTGVLTRPLANLMPQDETSAIRLDSLVRREAEIQIGTAEAGSPARAKVIDRHGQAHFVMVEPHDPEAVLREGETVLLAAREGQTFYGVQYQNPNLALN
ncbi:MAG: OB-fold-containig protein [Pseudomonadota bacterium]